MGQRIIDALELETIDPVYKIGDREIRLSTGNSANAVGGEAYRRALCAETRKAYANGTLKQVGIGTLSRDRWGSLGFLAVNGKTGASGDFTTLCPQMFYNKGCHYCYRLASLKSGVNNKLVGVNVWYGGEILRIKDKDVDMLNKNGGLRIQSFGDWMPQFSAQLADMLYDADMRGLQIKIITKEPSMIDYVAQLKRQGIGKALYFNLSADYAIERAGSKETADYTTFNAERPYMRDDAGDLWWKRAMTVEEASRYRDKYSWVNTRIVATTVDEFIRGLRDPRVDVVTGYHGNIRSWERIDSTTGEVKVNVEALGDSGMPVFGYDAQTGEWHLENQGKTKTHQALAAAIEENGLQYEYYAKSCCITGRCATCNGKCGKLARNFYVKNATNRDVESFVYWQENMEYDSDTIADQKVQYSMRDTAYIAPSDGSVKFSLRENVEQTKDLVAVHNWDDTSLDEMYEDAVLLGDTKKALSMLEEKARRVQADIITHPDVTTYKVHRGAPPKKTIKVYKTFTVDSSGRPTALFVSSNHPIPVGVWPHVRSEYQESEYKGRCHGQADIAFQHQRFRLAKAGRTGLYQAQAEWRILCQEHHVACIQARMACG